MSRTKIMAIVNATPDSFVPSSRLPQEFEGYLSSVIEAQPDIIDLGAESTRPGSMPVDAELQIERLKPAIKFLRKHSVIPISIDTQSSKVMQSMLDFGANMLNDVSAMENDPAMLPLVVKNAIPVILMHKKGQALIMQENPQYENFFEELTSYLIKRADLLLESGHPHEKIFLDPGIGFGKNFQHNQTIFARMSDLCALNFGIVCGHSRKSFIGKVLAHEGKDLPVDLRDNPSSILSFFAALVGCAFVRVHDIHVTRQALKLAEFVKGGKVDGLD